MRRTHAARRRKRPAPKKRPGAYETPAEFVQALEEELGPPKVSRPRRIQALAELFELFNRRRSEVRGMRYIDVPRLRDAYLRYHLPINAARAHYLLLHLLKLAPEIADLTDVVDLGSGPATSSLATRFGLPGARRFTLVDRSRSALQIGKRLLMACAGEPSAVETVTTHVTQLPTLPNLPSKALVWLSMVLNELCLGTTQGPDAETFLGHLERRLAPGSVVIIIEPALRGSGRQLLRFHDLCLETGGWDVLAPCTHQSTCPLLQAKGDPWCHFRFFWNAPPLVEDVAQPLGLSWHTPTFSYLVLRRTGEQKAPTSGKARVVGDPMDLRTGGKGIYVCQQGKRDVAQLGRDRIHRGDLVKTVDKSARLVERW